MIKLTLDKNKAYGTIYGVSALGAVYVQDNIEFDAQGKRVTPITDKEKEAHEAERKAYADLIAAENMDAEAKEEIKETTLADNVEAAEAAAVEAKKDMPDFSGFSKIQMINYGKKHFPSLKLTMNQTHDKLKAKLEGRF